MGPDPDPAPDNAECFPPLAPSARRFPSHARENVLPGCKQQ